MKNLRTIACPWLPVVVTGTLFLFLAGCQLPYGYTPCANGNPYGYPYNGQAGYPYPGYAYPGYAYPNANAAYQYNPYAVNPGTAPPANYIPPAPSGATQP